MVLFASPEFPFCLSSTLEETSTRDSLAQNKSVSLFPTEQLYPWSWFTPNFTHDLVGHRSPCTRCGEQMAWGRGGRHAACRLLPALPMCLVWFTHICKKIFWIHFSHLKRWRLPIKIQIPRFPEKFEQPSTALGLLSLSAAIGQSWVMATPSVEYTLSSSSSLACLHHLCASLVPVVTGLWTQRQRKNEGAERWGKEAVIS